LLYGETLSGTRREELEEEEEEEEEEEDADEDEELDNFFFSRSENTVEKIELPSLVKTRNLVLFGLLFITLKTKNKKKKISSKKKQKKKITWTLISK
jgi:CO dehydrogenase/acetyl-CoA synthase beta subunit